MDGFGKLENEENIYVIGDVHGCAAELQELLKLLPLDESCSLVLMGDYLDRGPASREVIETLIELRSRVRIYPLMGNHEALMLDFLRDPESPEAACFLFNGGGATLQSYSARPGHYSIPQHHVDFLQSLNVSILTEKYVFVHAGLPEVPLSELSLDLHLHDLLWIRKRFFESEFSYGKLVVHGHTPRSEVEITPRRINIDTGCVYANYLSAIHLPSLKVYQVARSASLEHLYLKDADKSSRKAARFEGKIAVRLMRGKRTLRFKTINFNEFGLLLKPKDSEKKQILDFNERIRGVLSTGRQHSFAFYGKVVRVELQEDGSYQYALSLRSPPRSEDDSFSL